jgi:AcrR family transcriptional regulator
MSLQDFRDNRAQEKRAAVIQAATTLFAECGLNAVSMATLAQAAGVSTATLYRHFVDKEAVFAEVIEYLVRNVLADHPAEAEDADPVSALRSVAMRYATLLSDPMVLGLLRAVVADTDASSGFRAKLSEYGSAIFANDFEHAIAAIFAQRSPDQSLNVHQASVELRGMLEHFTVVGGLLFNEVPGPHRLEHLVDRTLDSWHRCWGSKR